MSSFEDKVTATRDFLANRASLQRVTNHEEIGRVIGKLLYARHQRRIDTPVRRDKVIKVLRALDSQTLEKGGFMASALVTHFWDNEVSHRFYEDAEGRGVSGSPAAHRESAFNFSWASLDEPEEAEEDLCPTCGSRRVSVPDDIAALDEEPEFENDPF